MIRYARSALVAVNLVFAAVLVWYWLDGSGRPRSLHWQPPSPIQPEWPVAAAAPTSGQDTSAFLITLERPLFSPSRRPPPPPKPVEAEASTQVDPLASMQVVGIYGDGERGGIIAMIDGKMQRKSVGQRLGPWELRSIAGREITLAQGAQTRTLRITRTAVMGEAPVASSPSAAPSEASAISQRPEANVEDARRDRVRRLNALRAKGGLPPLQD